MTQCMWATYQCSRVTCWWRRRFHGPLSPSLARSGQMRPADPTGGFMKRYLHILELLAKLLWNLLGRRKKYRTMLIPRPDRIWWCTRNISAGGDALNRTAMKALKLLIIHVVSILFLFLFLVSSLVFLFLFLFLAFACRTAMKALKMSIIHVVAFVISWTPYAIMGTWSVS